MLIHVGIEEFEEEFRTPWVAGLIKHPSIDYATNAIHGWYNNEDKITIHPYPLFEKNKLGYFKMTDEIQGGAMSSFGVDYGFDGNEIQNYQKYIIDLNY